MPSKAIIPPPDTRRGGDWQMSTETAPSLLRKDDPSFARVIGVLGAAAIVFGGLALMLQASGRITFLGNGGITFALTLGLAGLLFHAAFDWEAQYRRIYMGFAYVVLVVGVFLMVVPYNNQVGALFGQGFGFLFLGLLFMLACLRNEDDIRLRKMAYSVLGALGALMAVVGLAGGLVKGEFLTPVGLLLAILGLIYLNAYIAGVGISDDFSYRAGQGLGAAGLLVFLIALGRSALPPLFYSWHWTQTQPADYLVPYGLLLMALGLLYFFVALLLCSDRRWVVLTRRELGTLFYSPVAYILLFAFIIAHWLAYFMVMLNMINSEASSPEPIVSAFILQWSAVISTIVVIPVLTMRLLSEEKRSGTLEVLLTAPVDEGAIVISKFLAACIMYLVMWAPFGLFLIYLRIGGGAPFDYRPLFSFAIGLTVTSAAFVSMGVFFSSLTRSQVASGMLTFAGMLALTLIFLINSVLGRLLAGSAWVTALRHISYIDVWIDTLDGRLLPRQLIFFVSMTVVWLFVSVKVLEARKWA